MSDYTPDPSVIPTDYELPDDGDVKSVASINPTLEGLADGVAHCNWPEQDATQRYRLASRGLTRVMRGGAVTVSATGWQVNLGLLWLQALVDYPYALIQPLEFPDGITLTVVSAYLKGTGHSAMPAHVPAMTVRKVNVATGVSSLVAATVNDPSANVVAYEVWHAVSATGIAEVIDNSTYLYYATIEGEWGTDAAVGLSYYGTRSSFTITAQDPGAS